MKRCPVCSQVFSVEFDFCLNDGTLLVVSPSQQNFGGFQSANETPTQVIPRSYSIPAQAAPNSAKWLFPLVGILSGLVVVLAFFAFFKESFSNKTAAPITRTETASSNNNRIAEPVRPQRETMPVAPPPANQTSSTMVTVNSPRDRYLALKDAPCTAPCGGTLTKIPHGTRLNLGTCKDQFEVADRRRGRWCSVSYGGQTGWIFDGFVTY